MENNDMNYLMWNLWAITFILSYSKAALVIAIFFAVMWLFKHIGKKKKKK